MENHSNYGEYDRYLSPLDVWAIAFGCTIGCGAFTMPGTTFLPVAGPVRSIIGLVIGMAIMLVIGSNFSLLMRSRPGTGGVYSYTKAAFGRDHAFLCAWFLALSYLTILFLNATSLFTVIRMVFGRRLQLGYNYYNIGGKVIFMGEVGASIVALAGVGFLFINAKPLLQRLQTILAFVLLATVLIVAGVCLTRLPALTALEQAGGAAPRGGLWTVVMLAPLAYVGFEVISLETAHFEFGVHRSRWIIFAAILVSGLVYILLTLVSVCATPDGYASWQAYVADLNALEGIPSVPTFNAAKSIMGDAGLFFIAIAALCAILTSMIAAYRATTRVLSTMAEDRILSARFEQTTYSILFIMAVSIVVSLFGRDASVCLMELTSLGAIVGFGYTSAATLRTARAAGPDGTKAPGKYVVTGAVGTVLSVVFAVVKLIPGLMAVENMSADAFLLLSIWCLIGFLFYLRTMAKAMRSAGGGLAGANGSAGSNAVCGVVLFALLLYSDFMWLGKRLIAAESLQAVRSMVRLEGTVVLAVVFIGFAVMMYIQQPPRRNRERGGASGPRRRK